MQTVFTVSVVATTTNGAESLPSFPVVVLFFNGKMTSIDFRDHQSSQLVWQAWLETSNGLDQPFTTLAMLDTFSLLANEPKRFYRVRLNPL